MSKGSKVHCTVSNVFNCTHVERVESTVNSLFWRPTPLPKASGRRWRPGTQALHEIRHYQRTTKLVIPRAAFIAYVNYLMYFCVFVSKESKEINKSNRFCTVCVERVERNFIISIVLQNG